MNEKDIRLGNKLLLYGEVVKVTEIGFRIDDHYLRVEGNKNGYYLDQFEPIELTEEILLKCGFNIFANNAVQYECIILIYEGKFRYKNSNIDIKYLHQLQNLYYCLVGTELKIEL